MSLRWGPLVLVLVASCERAYPGEDQPFAERDGLRLTASVEGAVIFVTLTNVGRGVEFVDGPCIGGARLHYDYFGVELADRGIWFIGDRNASACSTVFLEHGASLTLPLDVASWANEPCNRRTPLSRGRHRVTVYYWQKEAMLSLEGLAITVP